MNGSTSNGATCDRKNSNGARDLSFSSFFLSASGSLRICSRSSSTDESWARADPGIAAPSMPASKIMSGHCQGSVFTRSAPLTVSTSRKGGTIRELPVTRLAPPPRSIHDNCNMNPAAWEGRGGFQRGTGRPAGVEDGGSADHYPNPLVQGQLFTGTERAYGRKK